MSVFAKIRTGKTTGTLGPQCCRCLMLRSRCSSCGMSVHEVPCAKIHLRHCPIVEDLGVRIAVGVAMLVAPVKLSKRSEQHPLHGSKQDWGFACCKVP